MNKSSALTGAALGWIREDLDKQLRKVRLQIENLSSNALAGNEALLTIAEDLEHLRLTFKTLVLDGAAQVMGEMHALCLRLQDESPPGRESAMASLMESIVVVPAYLDRLQAGHRDLPVLLMPLINRLREVRGAEPVSEGTLFTPLLDVELPELEFVRRRGYDEPFDYFARRMRRQFEKALLDWQHDQEDLSLLSPLQEICETMRHHLERYDFKRLWWVATELVGGLIDGVAENDINLRRLLARLNLLMQNIAEGGEDAVDSAATTSITQALLFHVAKAPRGHAGLDLVRERFELERLIPDRDAWMRAHGTLSGRDREMYTSLSKAVQDELSLIKDALDLELRTGEVEPDRRHQSLEALTRLCDTLRMLGLSAAADDITETIPDFERSTASSRSEREKSLMTVAERLLVVESVLEEQIATLGEASPDHHPDMMTAWELRRIRSHLLDESVASVYLSQDAMRRRLGGDGDADPFGPLQQVAGALHMIGEEGVAAQATRLGLLLQKRLRHIFSEAGVRAKDLNAMTDAMAALELYLAARRDQQRDAERFLHILGDRIETLDTTRPVDAEVRPFPAPVPPAPASPEAAIEEAPEPVTADRPDETEPATELPVAETAPSAPEPETAAPVAAEATASSDLPSAIDPELREIFLEEYESVLDGLNEAIPDWINKASDVDALTRIRRAFHTLKGSGRMVGADELGDFSWQIEDMLNALLEGRVNDATDIQVVVRLAQATLPVLRQRLLQQTGTVGKPAILRIGELARALGRGERADWDALHPLLPPFMASMLPGAYKPSVSKTAADEDNLLAGELTENLRPIQELLEAISRDRATRAEEEQLRAVHTIAGALAMEPQGRDAEVAKALERVLETQARTRHRFSNESVWTLVSAVGQIQGRLDRLEGNGEAADPDEQAELIGQLMVLVREFETTEPGEETSRTFDPGRSVFASESPTADEASESEETAPTGLDESLLELEAEAEAEQLSDEELQAEAALDSDIAGIFLEEAGEVLARADTLLHQWRDDLSELRFVRHLQREIHTFKGGARMSGLLGIGDYSHSMESLLERIAEGRLDPTVEVVQLLEHACDRLHRWVEDVSAGRTPASEQALAAFEQQANALSNALPLQPEPEAEATADTAVREVHEIAEIAEEPAAAPERSDDSAGSGQVRVDSELLDKLVNAAGEVSIFRSRLEQQVGGLRSNLGEFDETITRMREQFRKLEIEIETQIRSNYTPASDHENSGFDPLEMDEFSTLHQLSRSLSESVADLMNLQDMLADNARKSEQLLIQQSRVATELQEGLMRTRMVPFGTIAPRLRRVVRSTAAESGKKARLQLQVVGSSDALDRNVLEHITVPLEHMMRNAVVHGVETPGQRKAAGKPPEGQISVTVESEATEFVIRIADDGAGIRLDAIRALAVERGLLDAGTEPRPEQLYEFILDSGFSTSDKVTRLAGRGVGMDVVSSEIKQIGGSLEIDSEAGRGTRFTIRIPFTLAIMQAIGVIAGKQRYLLPLSSVVGVSRLSPEEYTALVASENPRFQFAGEEYPVLDLESVLGEPEHPLERDSVSLLILNAGEQRAAFRVVELLPHREIVIKPVGPQISSIPGILGGSISANGEVLVILDPGPMIRHARLRGVRVAPVVAPVVEEQEHPVAMVVDDSITMRKVTSRVLESHGLEVVTARDGVEALELMQDRAPDILLLDIEMPRMDGYELAQHVRDDIRLRHIPIIMITSRAGQKHRDRAAQVGANAYLSKPYAESELVDEVDRLLQEGID